MAFAPRTPRGSFGNDTEGMGDFKSSLRGGSDSGRATPRGRTTRADRMTPRNAALSSKLLQKEESPKKRKGSGGARGAASSRGGSSARGWGQQARADADNMMWVQGPYGPIQVPIPEGYPFEGYDMDQFGPDYVPQYVLDQTGLEPAYTPGYNPYTYPMPYGMYNPFGVPFYGPYGAAPLPPNESSGTEESGRRGASKSRSSNKKAGGYKVPMAEPRLGFKMQVGYTVGPPTVVDQGGQ